MTPPPPNKQNKNKQKQKNNSESTVSCQVYIQFRSGLSSVTIKGTGCKKQCEVSQLALQVPVAQTFISNH